MSNSFNFHSNKFDIADFKHMRTYGLLNGRGMEAYESYLPLTLGLRDRFVPHGEAVMRYMVLVYDKQSPFRDSVPLLEQRKEQVASYVGIFGKSCYEVVSKLEDSFFVDALAEFLKAQNNLVWSLIVQNEEVFFSNQKQVLSQLSIDGKDTDRLRAAELQGKLLSQQSLIRKELIALYSELTGNDPLAEQKMRERTSYTPEYVAGLLSASVYDEPQEVLVEAAYEEEEEEEEEEYDD